MQSDWHFKHSLWLQDRLSRASLEAKKQVEKTVGVLQAKYDIAASLMVQVADLAGNDHFQQVCIELIVMY